LRNIKDVYDKHRTFLETIPKGKKRNDTLVELNVLNSVDNVCHTTIIQNAWAIGQKVEVHGWCYSLEDGIIRDLNLHVGSVEKLRDIYKMAKIGTKSSSSL